LFDLSYQGRMPVDKAPKRQAWTAQQKWFAVELKRKFPDKKLMISLLLSRLSLIVMSVHRHCARG
jgi:hypothetical protein